MFQSLKTALQQAQAHAQCARECFERIQVLAPNGLRPVIDLANLAREAGLRPTDVDEPVREIAAGSRGAGKDEGPASGPGRATDPAWH